MPVGDQAHLLIAASVMMIYPLLWLVASSLRPTESSSAPRPLVNDLYVENYTKGWYALSYPFGHYIINSAIVVLGAIAGNLFACTLAAYAFARLKFRLKRLWFAIMLLDASCCPSMWSSCRSTSCSTRWAG